MSNTEHCIAYNDKPACHPWVLRRILNTESHEELCTNGLATINGQIYAVKLLTVIVRFFYFFLQVQREKEKQIKNAEKCTIATLMDDSIMARYIIMGLL